MSISDSDVIDDLSVMLCRKDKELRTLKEILFCKNNTIKRLERILIYNYDYWRCSKCNEVYQESEALPGVDDICALCYERRDEK